MKGKLVTDKVARRTVPAAVVANHVEVAPQPQVFARNLVGGIERQIHP